MPDYLVIGVYFAIFVVMGLWFSRRQNTTSKFFLANRSIPAWAIAFTLMASIISTSSIVASPGLVYQKGLILLLGHCTLPLVMIFVACFVVSFYRHVVRMSAYEFLNKRFGRGARLYSSFGFLTDRVFDVGMTLVTTAIPIQVMTGWTIGRIILALGLFAMLYACISGIEGVVWMNVFQGMVIFGTLAVILGTLLLSPSAGAPFAVVGEAWRGGRFSLGSFELSWSSLADPDHTTQWVFLLAFLVLWGRRYMADQHMVQRYLIARSDREAAQGALWNALYCVPVWATCMVIGACLYGYYQLSGASAPDLPDHVVPHFLVNTFPSGLVGLMLAVIMATSVSTMGGDLNSLACVATSDYFIPMLPDSSDRIRTLFGRATILVAGSLVMAVAWLLIPELGQKPLAERGVIIGAVLSGGCLGLFVLGSATSRATYKGSLVGIVACLLFSTWGILTGGGDERRVDMGVNFPLNPLLVGVLGHAVLFGVGYTASLLLGGHRPENVKQLTIYRGPSTDEHGPAVDQGVHALDKDE